MRAVDETPVTWVSSSVTVALTLLVFWAPGWCGLGILRVRGLQRFSLAPLVTTLLCGAGAVGVGLLRLRWNALSLLVTCLVAFVAAGLVRRRSEVGAQGRAWEADGGASGGRRAPLLVGAAVAAGALSILVPLAIGMGSPERTLNAWDAPFHLNALEFIRETGLASPLDILTMFGNGTHQGVYPTGWHAVAALIPVWPSRAVVFTVAAYVPLALAWSAGLASLTRSLFPDRPSAATLAPLFAASGAVPVYAMSTEGIVANAWALALTPAAGAALITAWRNRRPRDEGIALACVLGLGLAHPGPVIALAVASLPLSAPVVFRRAQRALRQPRSAAFAVGGGVIGAAGLVWALRDTALGFVLGLSGQASSRWPWSAFDVANGSQGVTVSSGVIVVVAAATAVRPVWATRRLRGLLVGGAILLLLPVVADSRLGLATVLIRPWYSEVARLAPVAWSLTVALACVGIAEGVHHLLASGRLDAGSRPQLVLPLVAAVIVLAVAVPTVLGSERLAGRALSDSVDAAPFVSAEEQKMIDRLPRELDPTQAVLGDADSGASHLYGLIGQRVSLTNFFSRPDAAVRYVSTHLASLGSDPGVCRSLRADHIGYLYIDSRPSWVGTSVQAFETPPPAGVALVDRGGSAAVYSVTACR